MFERSYFERGADFSRKLIRTKRVHVCEQHWPGTLNLNPRCGLDLIEIRRELDFRSEFAFESQTNFDAGIEQELGVQSTRLLAQSFANCFRFGMNFQLLVDISHMKGNRMHCYPQQT